MRSVLYDERTRAPTVIDVDLSQMIDAPVSVLSLWQRTGGALSRGCSRALELVGPTPLSAQGFNECTDEGWDLHTAEGTLLGAGTALYLAIAACAQAGFIPSSLQCLAAVAAGVAVLWETVQVVHYQRIYDECMEYIPPPPGPDPLVSPGGGGGSEQEGECVTIFWEISFDGGMTWYPAGSTTYC